MPQVKPDYSVLSFILLCYLPTHPFLSVLVLTVKGAGGKPFPSAPVERVIFLEYVWPEFTMGEYILSSISKESYSCK